MHAYVERVWEVLTDLAYADETLRGVEHVEMITEGSKEATEQMQVTVADAPTHMVIEAESAGVHTSRSSLAQPQLMPLGWQ